MAPAQAGSRRLHRLSARAADLETLAELTAEGLTAAGPAIPAAVWRAHQGTAAAARAARYDLRRSLAEQLATPAPAVPA